MDPGDTRLRTVVIRISLKIRSFLDFHAYLVGLQGETTLIPKPWPPSFGLVQTHFSPQANTTFLTLLGHVLQFSLFVFGSVHN